MKKFFIALILLVALVGSAIAINTATIGVQFSITPNADAVRTALDALPGLTVVSVSASGSTVEATIRFEESQVDRPTIETALKGISGYTKVDPWGDVPRVKVSEDSELAFIDRVWESVVSGNQALRSTSGGPSGITGVIYYNGKTGQWELKSYQVRLDDLRRSLGAGAPATATPEPVLQSYIIGMRPGNPNPVYYRYVDHRWKYHSTPARTAFFEDIPSRNIFTSFTLFRGEDFCGGMKNLKAFLAEQDPPRQIEFIDDDLRRVLRTTGADLDLLVKFVLEIRPAGYTC